MKATGQAYDSARRFAAAVNTAAGPPPGAAPTLAAQLRELAELHREGVLTDEELAAAKARLIG